MIPIPSRLQEFSSPLIRSLYDPYIIPFIGIWTLACRGGRDPRLAIRKPVRPATESRASLFSRAARLGSAVPRAARSPTRGAQAAGDSGPCQMEGITWYTSVCILYIYMYVYGLHTYRPTYLPTYLPTYVRTYKHTYKCAYVHYMHNITYVRTYVRTYIHTYMHAYIHAYVRSLLATCMYNFCGVR